MKSKILLGVAVLAFALGLFGRVAVGIAKYAVGRAEYGGTLHLGGHEIYLPSAWWIAEKTSDGFIVARIPRPFEKMFFVLRLYETNESKCADLIGEWKNECDANGFIKISKEERGRVDVNIVFVEEGIGLFGKALTRTQVADFDEFSKTIKVSLQ